MGGGPSLPSQLKEIFGLPVSILLVDPNQIINYLNIKNVSKGTSDEIAKDIAFKSAAEIASLLQTVPGLQQFGGVITVLGGLLQLVSSLNQDNGQKISQQIGKNSMMDHYASMCKYLANANEDIIQGRIQFAFESLQQNYFQFRQILDKGIFQTWYRSINDQVSLKLLVLIYKQTALMLQLTTQVLKTMQVDKSSKMWQLQSFYIKILAQLKQRTINFRIGMISFFCSPHGWVQTNFSDGAKGLKRTFSGDWTDSCHQYYLQCKSQADQELQKIDLN